MDSDRNIATSFSFLIPFRNREIERVENCLKSIATQTYKNFEVIFIDYGSDLEIAQKTREVVSRFGYNYLYSDTRYMFWNQNHALNIGLNVAKNEYIIRLDVDIILPPNFLDKISNSINDIQFINCQCYYTDQNFDYVNISKDKLAKLSISDFSATGLCMIVAKKYLLKINGFNEFYILWGFDDLDTTRSLQNLGLQLVWMDAIKVPLLHQWHKKNTSTLSELIYETKKKYYLNGTNLGSSHIGLKITTEERDCLKIIPLLDERKKITVSGYLESFRFE